MQIKKDEIRDALLREAEKEFYNKGFIVGSVRQIVKAAGTTIGNFYNYFDSKQTIFEELVKDEYASFMFVFNNHDSEGSEFLPDSLDPVKWRKELVKFIEYIMSIFSDRFVLLVECSEGTKFSNVRMDFVNLIKDHFIDHLQQFHAGYADCGLAEIISEQFLNGIILILRKYKDKDIRKQLLADHILYHLTGSMGFIKSLKE